MAEPSPIAVVLEVGSKRVIASAIDWPGWARIGRDEPGALEALVHYGPRYARAIGTAKMDVPAPGGPGDFEIAERLEGNATTDYGVPGMAPTGDSAPPDTAQLERLEAILTACWAALERAAALAGGKTLRKGPRGGGRELEAIVEHVVDAHAGYLGTMGYRMQGRGSEAGLAYIAALRDASVDALALAVANELPTLGPRGGKRWSPRYFVRRAAWHILDHAWEIEDRIDG